MTSLVAYGSSDDEQDEPVERPAKIAKTETSTAHRSTPAAAQHKTQVSYAASEQSSAAQTEPPIRDEGPLKDAPAPGPSLAQPEAHIPLPEESHSAPVSPYSYERQRLRELTMPTVPNFDIPDSPPPHPANSEEAATLATTTKKFERFLELKKQGVHFNEKMQNSTSLRNPSLLPKLMEFAGISQADSYRSSLPEEVGVAVEWPEECYIESLMRQNERKQKKKLVERDKLDFVPESKQVGTQAKHSKFDKR